MTISQQPLTKIEKRRIREAAGAHRSCEVKVVSGNKEPELTGRSYYWTTMSGKTEIRYPSAYRWPKLYHNSTLRVEVGEGWVADQRRTREWPQSIAESLGAFAARLGRMSDSMRPLDKFARDTLGLGYGTWRRDAELRLRVLTAVHEARKNRVTV